MVKDNKVRITITVSKEQDARIQEIADMMGVSKSAFIALATGEKIMQYNKAFDVLQALAEQMASSSEIEGQMSVFDILKGQSVSNN